MALALGRTIELMFERWFVNLVARMGSIALLPGIAEHTILEPKPALVRVQP